MFGPWLRDRSEPADPLRHRTHCRRARVLRRPAAARPAHVPPAARRWSRPTPPHCRSPTQSSPLSPPCGSPPTSMTSPPYYVRPPAYCVRAECWRTTGSTRASTVHTPKAASMAGASSTRRTAPSAGIRRTLVGRGRYPPPPRHATSTARRPAQLVHRGGPDDHPNGGTTHRPGALGPGPTLREAITVGRVGELAWENLRVQIGLLGSFEVRADDGSLGRRAGCSVARAVDCPGARAGARRVEGDAGRLDLG